MLLVVYNNLMIKPEGSGHLQKKIKDYVISYCATELYGKNLHGEIRAGYKNNEHKVVLFRITELPITPLLSEFLQLQEQYSDLSGYARTIYEPIHSSANHYQPLEYFPRTFHSEHATFKHNAKYLDEYVEKFLRVYAFFYNMRVPHGNLTPHNIGITFEGKVKLMDFGTNNDNKSFEEKARQDFNDFKHMIAVILEKDDNFPAKFCSFNKEQHQNWQHLFGIWHITSPLQPLYFPRKSYTENILTLLYKLYNQLSQKQLSKHLLLAIRLLMLNYVQRSQQEHLQFQKGQLQSIVGGLEEWDLQVMNSTLMGAIQDPDYYQLSPQHRLVLICCLVPQLNHEYAYFQIVGEFSSADSRRNQLLGDSLLLTYKMTILSNLLAEKPVPQFVPTYN